MSSSRAAPPRDLRAGEPEPEVLGDGQVRVDPAALGDERDARASDAPRCARPRIDAAGEADLAAVHRDEPHDRVERRRLAGAVRADQADDLPAADLEAQVRGPPRRRRSGPRARRARAPTVIPRPPAPRRGTRPSTSRLARISAGAPSASVRALVEHLDPVAHVHHERHVVVDQEHARRVLVAHRADDRRRTPAPRPPAARRPARRGAGSAAPSRARGRRRACARRRAARPPAGWSPRRSSPSSSSSRAGAPARLARPGARAERRDLDVLAHATAPRTTGCAETCARARRGRGGAGSTT